VGWDERLPFSSLLPWALVALAVIVLGCFVVATSSIGISVAARVGIYVVFSVGLARLFPHPGDPYRGWLNRVTSSIVLLTAVLLSVALLWYVIDTTYRCIKLGQIIIEQQPDWSDDTIANTAAELGIDPQLAGSPGSTTYEAVEPSLGGLVSIRFLARRTVFLERLIYEAALAYLFLFLSRSPVFDQYVMSWFLILIFTLALLGVLGSALWLRYSAGKARRAAADTVSRSLKMLWLGYSTSPGDPPKDAIEALEEIGRAVKDLKTGAFSALSDDPVARAAAMILGGIGALFSLQPIQQLLR
jgi:hypothetical protein